MRRVALAAAALALWVGVAAAAPDFAGLNFQPYSPPKPAPTFTLSDLQGTKRALGDFQGKVVLLFFWATW